MMNAWVKIVLLSRTLVEKECDMLDKQIDIVAMSGFGVSCQSVFDRLSWLIERKQDVLYLEWLRKNMLAQIPQHQRDIIACLLGQESVEHMSNRLGLDWSIISKRLSVINCKCVSWLKDLGHTDSSLYQMYKDVSLITALYKKLAPRKRASTSRSVA